MNRQGQSPMHQSHVEISCEATQVTDVNSFADARADILILLPRTNFSVKNQMNGVFRQAQRAFTRKL